MVATAAGEVEVVVDVAFVEVFDEVVLAWVDVEELLVVMEVDAEPDFW